MARFERDLRIHVSEFQVDGLLVRFLELRYTFCSHLATRGAPATAIQELAGHAEWETSDEAAKSGRP